MGSARPQTAGLARKLRQIREGLKLSQASMAHLLRKQDLPVQLKVYPGNVSRFEQGIREPSVLVLLAYAKAAGVSIEMLVDVRAHLPRHLSGKRRKR